MKQENVDNYSAYFIFLYTFLSLSDGFHPWIETPAADDDMIGNEVVWRTLFIYQATFFNSVVPT